MKPNDRFSFLKNNRVSQDPTTLVQCYLPIIGQDALSLYLYTLAFWDDGQKEHLLHQSSTTSILGWTDS